VELSCKYLPIFAFLQSQFIAVYACEYSPSRANTVA